jgi:hypothetical protein
MPSPLFWKTWSSPMKLIFADVLERIKLISSALQPCIRL